MECLASVGHQDNPEAIHGKLQKLVYHDNLAFDLLSYFDGDIQYKYNSYHGNTNVTMVSHKLNFSFYCCTCTCYIPYIATNDIDRSSDNCYRLI